jgi:hypothetical protein
VANPSQHHENANFSMLIAIPGFAKATSYPRVDKRFNKISAAIEKLDLG